MRVLVNDQWNCGKLGNLSGPTCISERPRVSGHVAAAPLLPLVTLKQMYNYLVNSALMKLLGLAEMTTCKQARSSQAYSRPYFDAVSCN